MTAITGNTFPVRDQLKALGGRWDAARKCWMVPDDKAEEASRLLFPASGMNARRLVTGGPTTYPRRGPRTCKDCGCRINYGVFCGKCEYR
jgi:hypothetical protein